MDLLESFEKEFIIGDWPVKTLLDHGFQQDTRSDRRYLRDLSSCSIAVDFSTFDAALGSKSNATVNILYAWGQKDARWVLWSGLVPFEMMGKFLDAALPILEPLPVGYFSNDPTLRQDIAHKLNLAVRKNAFFAESELDPREFILGRHWPVGHLVKLGYRQTPGNPDAWVKPLHDIGYTILVYPQKGKHEHMNEVKLEGVLKPEDSAGTGVWSGLVDDRYTVPVAQELERLVRAGVQGYNAWCAGIRDFYAKLISEGLNPKQYIMSNEWIIDGLRKQKFEPLTQDRKYWVYRFYAKRSKTWGAVVVWLDVDRAHMTVEQLKGTDYQQVWGNYVGLPFVLQMVPVLIKAYHTMRSNPRTEEFKHSLSMMVAGIGRETFKAQFDNVYKFDSGSYASFFNFTEAVDPKVFINRVGPFFEFKTKLEELGWTYRGIRTTVNVKTEAEGTIHYWNKGHWSGETGPVLLDCWAKDFEEDGRWRISAYGAGERDVLSDEMDANGNPLIETKRWDTEEYIQPDGMTPSEFAEMVSDQIENSA